MFPAKVEIPAESAYAGQTRWRRPEHAPMAAQVKNIAARTRQTVLERL
jgi:hypothetical protein